MAHIKYGDDGLSSKLEAWADKVLEDAQRGVTETALIIESQAKTLAPVDVGFLRESIDSIHLGNAHSIVSVGADYAPYVEYGTGAFATNGSRAKKIPWVYMDIDGEFHFTYGQVAQPFWTPALLAGKAYFKNYFS